MKIDCFISETCSSEDQLRINIAEALERESVDADVHFHLINETEAKRLGIMGSPSVFLDGADILPGDIPGAS